MVVVMVGVSPALSGSPAAAGAVPWQGWRQGGSQRIGAGDSESTASSLPGSWPGGEVGAELGARCEL